MYSRLFIMWLVALIVFSSCGPQKKVVTQKQTPKTSKTKPAPKPPTKPTPIITGEKQTPITNPVETQKPKPVATYKQVVQNYIANFNGIAKQEMTLHGIPASITLAQGILESGAGRGDLSKRANNHFGIKCHKGWDGDRVYHDDDASQECFRKYPDANLSYKDHSLFLAKRSRYSSLFKLPILDYKAWARGLKKAGYATDPKYPNKLISIIERYNLQAYDQEVIGSSPMPNTNPTLDQNLVQTYSVKKGDTLYSISKKFNLSVDSLKEYNELTNSTLSIGQVLYLNAKK